MASHGANSLEGLKALCRSRTTCAEVREGGLWIAGERLLAGRGGAGEASYLVSSLNSPNTPSMALAWDIMERRKTVGALIRVVRETISM